MNGLGESTLRKRSNAFSGAVSSAQRIGSSHSRLPNLLDGLETCGSHFPFHLDNAYSTADPRLHGHVREVERKSEADNGNEPMLSVRYVRDILNCS